MGATIALPFLEAMVPAQTPLKSTAAKSKTRFYGIEFPHGASGSCQYGRKNHLWSPVKEGRDFEFTSALMPFEPFRDYVTIVSYADLHGADPWTPDEVGGDHSRAASVFLTGAHPKMTEGADYLNGPSIDQLFAKQFSKDDPIPTLELGIEDTGTLVGSCGFGYSCVYKYSISWASPTQPLPPQIDPRNVFERLFGDGSSAQQRVVRRKEDRSILDSVMGKVDNLKKNLDPSDRTRLTNYLDSVREIERRIQKVKQFNSAASDRELPTAPVGVPDSFDEHFKLMMDLTVVGFQSEVNHAASMMLARNVSSRVYPESGVKTPYHSGSHHGEVPEKIEEFNRLNRYHNSLIAYLMDRMVNTNDGDGNLLDHSVIYYGSGHGNAHIHEHKRNPLVILGKGNGALKGNMHYACKDGTPQANALLTMCHRLGIPVDGIGDSTGELEL